MEAHISIKVLGITSKETLKSLNKGFFGEDNPEKEITLFVGHSSFDIPIGFKFEKIANTAGSLIEQTPIILKKVTQQFGILFEEIPHGYKTICRFEFTEGKIPSSVRMLPIIKGWYDSKIHLTFY